LVKLHADTVFNWIVEFYIYICNILHDVKLYFRTRIEYLGMNVKVTEEEIDVSGATVFQRKYSSSLNKKNMVLIHGWSFTSKNWEDVGIFDHLAGLGFNAYAVDYPGFGKSPVSEKYRLDRGDLARGPKFVSDYLSSSKLDHAFLLGASMGGGIAILSALEYPQKIDGIVAVAPAWIEKEEHRMKALEKPVLFVWGSDDRVVPVDLGKGYSKAVKGSKLEIVKGSGHPVYLEKTEQFLSVLDEFLKQFS